MDCSFPALPNHDYIVLPNRNSHETRLGSIETLRHIGRDNFSLPDRRPGLVDENTRGTQQWNGPNNAQALTTLDASEEQDALIDCDQYSGSGMRLQDQVWPVNTNHDMDSVVSYHVPSPYDAYLMDTSTSMPCWTADSYFLNQPSSQHSNAVLFQPDLAMIQGTSLPSIDDHPLTSHLSDHHYPSDAVSTEQEQSHTPPNAKTVMIGAEDVVTRIGSVYSNGRFVCDAEECKGQTFARQAELRRHHTTLHATNKPNFWCHVPTCRRSISGGYEAFHRKDKLVAHVRTMHSGVHKGLSIGSSNVQQ